MAGFETSSTTLSFCLYELSKNIDYQENAFQEIQELISKYGSLTYDAVVEMNYAELLLLGSKSLFIFF